MNNKLNKKNEYNIPIISFHGDKICSIKLENTAFRLASNKVSVDKRYKNFQKQTKKKFTQDEDNTINSHLIYKSQKQEREAEQKAMIQANENKRRMEDRQAIFQARDNQQPQLNNLQAPVADQRSIRDARIAGIRANFQSIAQTGVFRRPVIYRSEKIITGDTGTKDTFADKENPENTGGVYFSR